MQIQKYILVTGGAGYIGSHTVVELYANGFIPVIVDDFRNANPIILEGIEKITGNTPHLYRMDVCDKESLRSVFEKYTFSGIIHFAAYKAVGESVDEPLKYYYNNLVSLISVLELAEEFKVSSFVFSSSCTVYGDPGTETEVTENTPLTKAISPYGNTKLISEEILADFHISSPRLKIIRLRYFNPVGAHPSSLIGEYPIGRPNNILPFITQTAIGKQRELLVFGNDYPTLDGTCIRDYVHVCDLADAHVKSLDFLQDQTSDCNEFMNIGTGKGTSVLELIHSFEQISSQKLNWKFAPRRAGDVVEIYANADKARKLLNWLPVYTINDAVQHAWNWEKKLNEYA